jgi:hypothetical protein
MAFRFQLNAGVLAHYRWGSLLPRFGLAVDIHKRSLPEFLACVSREIGSWRTEIAFRTYVAFQHEVVHYLQDVTTGIGHWDFLVMRKWIPMILGEARVARQSPRSLRSYFTKRRYGNEERILDELVYLPTNKLSRTRQSALLKNLNLGATAKVRPRDVRPYYIESLLEAEAATTVFLKWREVKKSTGLGWEIAAQHRELYDPWVMPSIYKTLYLDFAQVTMGHLKDRFQKEPNIFEAALLMHNLLLMMLVELSCAYPPPKMFDEGAFSRADYEPGLKFARLARAYHRLPDQPEPFLDIFFKSDINRLEELLSPYMEYQYLPYKKVYEQWAAVFAQMSETDDDRILQMRKNAAIEKTLKPERMIKKTLASFLDHGLRLPLCTGKGYVGYAFTFEDLNPDEDKIFFVDLQRHNRDAALADYFMTGRNFVCPLAENQVCEIATSHCSNGMANFKPLPKDRRCSIRVGLTDSGLL